MSLLDQQKLVKYKWHNPDFVSCGDIVTIVQLQDCTQSWTAIYLNISACSTPKTSLVVDSSQPVPAEEDGRFMRYQLGVKLAHGSGCLKAFISTTACRCFRPQSCCQ